ncbi:heat-shock protein [Photobacterium damselae]|uniref:stationary phase growth adaptation protein n=1 Tax=Gammaproteobacteria TaxID=1236 RepID=UPI001EDF4E72|nr:MULTISPECIES: stationary phase growth adaptation protein [Gammaproteobacteria]MCG3814274.1 heat-shock protein [Photobacterium damselae]MCG3880379.1 heat-shock protein [Psychrobacter sp. Ps6]
MTNVTAKKKKLILDKETHWQPFRLDDQVYDLSHLDGQVVEYVQPAKGKNPARNYKFYVTYSFHCFAKDYEHLTDEDRIRLEYKTTKDSRPFCFIRYELSKKLPMIIANLGQANLVFHGGYESFATCDIQSEHGETIQYYISFVAYRENKKLRLHIKSAYPLDEPLGKVKKVKFFSIALNLLKNKTLPKPQM